MWQQIRKGWTEMGIIYFGTGSWGDLRLELALGLVMKDEQDLLVVGAPRIN